MTVEPKQLSVVVADRAFEAWLLAGLGKHFGGKPPKKAKRELTRILGHDYKETRDGPDLFCSMDLDKARNLSPSLNEFLNALAC